VDARVEPAGGQLHLGPDARRGPGPAAVLGVDQGAEVARAVATRGGGELEAEEVARRARLGLAPGDAAVGRAVDDALLAGDPGAPRVEAGDREERPLRPGVLPLPGLAPVRGVEDAAQLAHHPAVAVGREAGGEEALADLAQADGRGARRGGKRPEDEERGAGERPSAHAVALRRRGGTRLARSAPTSSCSYCANRRGSAPRR